MKMFDEEHEHNHMRRHLMHNRNWMRHTAMVPKGFIRYHVLEALNEKPMSGSELMGQIEKNTGGRWKPSPGSIYPLLAWLQDNGYVKELPTENGLKRYELTQSGKDLLEEQAQVRRKFREEGGFFSEPFFDRFFMKMPPEKSERVRMSMKRLATSTFKLAHTLKETYSEKAMDEALRVLDETATKLEQINSTLKGENKNESK
jgi:DNA-binding PadR family transcriptional regulator